MTGEQDYDSADQMIRTAYHVRPINAFRTLAMGLDGSNAIPIKVASDGTVATSSGGGGGGDGALLDGVDPSIKATVRDYSGANPLSVELTDVDGNPANLVPGISEDTQHNTGDRGGLALAVRNDDGGSALTDADGDYSPVSVDRFGQLFVKSIVLPVTVIPQTASTPATTNVSASASSVSLLSTTATRRGATFFNDSAAIAYLKLGATASTTSFTVKMQPDAYYELPFNYVGAVDAIWASATGSMRVTELTA